MIKRFLFLTAILLLSGGCTTLLSPPPKQKLYDLGAPPAPLRDTGASPGAIIVRGPSWLAYSAMQYRFDFIQPSSRELYTESSWVAQPVEMVQRYLVIALGADQNMRSGCQLRVELDEFAQAFATPQQSEAVLKARADLVTNPGEPALVRRSFEVRMPAARADAAAGVAAHQQGVHQLAVEIKDWLQSLNAAGGDLQRRCAWKESEIR